MKSRILLTIVSLVLVSPCFGGPKIKPTGPVCIRNADFSVACILEEKSDIDALIACFERAEEIGGSVAPRTFSHKIDLSDRWLYDVERGELMLLSKSKQPIYRLSQSDIKIVKSLIQKKTPNQARQP